MTLKVYTDFVLNALSYKHVTWKGRRRGFERELFFMKMEQSNIPQGFSFSQTLTPLFCCINNIYC